MESIWMLICVLVDLLFQVYAVNCSMKSRSKSTEVLLYCGANGCCAKGCMRNAKGKCVMEECTGSLTGWLRRPVTISCYFHWFLILSAGLFTAIMAVLVLYSLGLKVRNCWRQRFSTRYRPIRNVSGVSSASTPC
ncbi:uncharacterized protein LOC117896658 [Drosophila subobscura]|uniref:uncharacterized protein LOC117896658 n=1 Tax=Drosophila subobscura TaxID=7241 RepID=UPI00155A7B55|nr:uncharacterized protein LOC117896658 [Drosophila subobscura]